MNLTALTQRSLTLFAAVGGWRTVAEGVASRVVFLIAYLLTDQVATSGLTAVGGVLVFAVVRVCTDRRYWAAVVELLVVGLSALVAGSTGNAVDFYLPAVVTSVVPGVVVLASIVVRWPLVGVVLGIARGERFSWRRDHELRRRYQLCTGVFLAKFVLATAVLVPLYLAGSLTPLGIAATLLTSPTAGVCIYLCWRILRTPPLPA